MSRKRGLKGKNQQPCLVLLNFHLYIKRKKIKDFLSFSNLMLDSFCYAFFNKKYIAKKI